MNGVLGQLVGLGIVIVVAIGAVLLVLRGSQSPAPPATTSVLGYPPDRFPMQRVVQHSTLQALAHTQIRLHRVLRQLPPASDGAIWLQAFLHELRHIMDTAYRVALVTEVYDHLAPLNHVVAEVQRSEHEIAEYVARQLLAQGGDRENELLAGRLATLRLCARELANVSVGSLAETIKLT